MCLREIVCSGLGIMVGEVRVATGSVNSVNLGYFVELPEL